MAPNDRLSTSALPIQDLNESPFERNDCRINFHARQPFIRYEHRRRSRFPSQGQGQVNRLPGVATLLRRHEAMQARGIIATVRDPAYERGSPEANNECWTPPRFPESPESKWVPLTSALEATRERLDDWSSNLGRFERQTIDQVLENRTECKASSPVVRSPEPVSESRPKTSRYLREIDRRRILMRIAQGEKQSALAKEYQVSRAAICNLNKHRAEVLSRNHEHPLAKHPKRRMLAKGKRQEIVDNQSSDTSGR